MFIATLRVSGWTPWSRNLRIISTVLRGHIWKDYGGGDERERTVLSIAVVGANPLQIGNLIVYMLVRKAFLFLKWFLHQGTQNTNAQIEFSLMTLCFLCTVHLNMMYLDKQTFSSSPYPQVLHVISSTLYWHYLAGPGSIWILASGFNCAVSGD